MNNLEKKYRWICGVCGWKTIQEPKTCIQCDNDAEFEKITLDCYLYNSQTDEVD